MSQRKWNSPSVSAAAFGSESRPSLPSAVTATKMRQRHSLTHDYGSDDRVTMACGNGASDPRIPSHTCSRPISQQGVRRAGASSEATGDLSTWPLSLAGISHLASWQ